MTNRHLRQDFPDLGGRVRTLRAARGWRQVDLAARARMAIVTIGEAEQWDCASIGTVERLARALGVPTEELTGAKPAK